MKTSQVCLIGNFNIDLIIRNVPQLPLWGQEVAGDNYMQVSSGQAGYTSFALRALGVPTKTIGYLGDDLYGQQILNDLIQKGIDITGIEIVSGQRTAITVAVVRPDGERAFISDFSFQRVARETIIQRHWKQVEPAKYVCLLGLFCLPGFNLMNIAAFLRNMKAQGQVTLLDTGWDPAGWPSQHLAGVDELLRHTSIFIPNMDEARAITQCEFPEDAAQKLRKKGAELVVIKLGKEGSYASAGDQTYRQPALPTEVFDAVGAGDVFNAGFLYAFEKGWEMDSCLIFGSAASALYISRSENRFPTRQEVYNYAKHYTKLPNG